MTAWLLIAFALLVALPAHADQEGAGPSQQASAPIEVEEPGDPFERQTPRSSMNALLDAIEKREYDVASRYLDLRFMPAQYREVEGLELAKMLDFVISRRLRVDLGGLSDEPEGDRTDGLPRTREALGVMHDGDESMTLYLQRVPSGDGLPVWKVSSVTVAGIAELYEKLDYPPVVKWFESTIPDGRLLGLEYFKWVIILLVMGISYPFVYLIGVALSRMMSRKGSPLRPRLRAFMVRPVAVFVIFLIGRSVLLDLGMGVTTQRIAKSNTLILIVSTWVVISGISLIRDVLTARLKKQERLAAMALLRPLANSIKFIVALSGLMIWLDNIGYDITTLLAGLGIGGLAIALALQKPLEDMFGAVTLFTQQPVHVHDFCRFGAILGTVEEIGLRSSRIRTLDNTVVTAPNARIANEYIENISARGSIRYRAEVRLQYDTSAEQLRKILGEMRALLEGESRLIEQKTRARLKRLGKHGFVIEALGYVETTVYAEYLEVAEGLNLGIAEIVSGVGAKFATPIEGVAG